ncbi:MAG: DUF362 domain-containing protein [Syntrophobacterales bacterium]|jgi:uncharacterized protein (DUF362 family)|nr:DUF362 domain-containing protein [Syntrophobacterales bacterium]
MALPIILSKGKFTAQFRRRFFSYCENINAGDYPLTRWKQWTDNPAIVIFRAVRDGKTAGWIAYDKSRSRVQEICIDGRGSMPELWTAMMDALIVRENLIAFELLADDAGKYNWAVEYGFRPTHTFKMNGGIPLVQMDLSWAILREKLDGLQPAAAYRTKEKVAIERVPETSTNEEVKTGLRRLIRKLGGLKRFVKPGQTVVIKPNVVSDHGLKDGEYKGGIITDIRVVRALTEILLPVAARVIIAEGSSINRSETSKMFAHYGYDRLADMDRKKVSLVDLNKDDTTEKTILGGKRMVSRKIPLTLERADVIISVPVLKIHFAAVASLSIKHLQGAVPPLEKYMTHFFGLWQNLVNIHHVIKPKLTIIDGLTGQEDFGPVSGVPKEMGLLIGGTNPVAVDSVAMKIMGLDPLASPPVWLAYMQGMGPVEENMITVVGPGIEEVMSPFRQPAIDLTGGRDITIHADRACPGCKGYLHFVLSKLRRPDPKDPSRLLIDRPFNKRVNIFLGPAGDGMARPEENNENNVFMGICQQHYEWAGTHLPGCPPHAEVIMNGIFELFPDVERPQYADKTEEAKLSEMLREVLSMDRA